MLESIPKHESLTVEFKSDRGRLPDADLAAAVICLANTEGGDLYVGIEADGKVTGLHPAHQNVAGLAAMIANRTVPPLSVRVEAIDTPSGRVAKVAVPKSRQLVATSEGLVLGSYHTWILPNSWGARSATRGTWPNPALKRTTACGLRNLISMPPAR